MNLTQELLLPSLSLIAAVLYGAMLALASWRAPWGFLKQEGNLHVFLGASVALMALWTIRAATIPGLGYHYYGATLLTLMFGWELATIGISVVLIANVLNGGGDWPSLPVNALVLGIVPILVSHAILRVSERRLPANLFVYIFACGYFGAGLAFLASVLVASGILVLGPAFTFDTLSEQFFPLVFLMAVPEAFITGFVIAILTVYRPGWVRTFDDEVYLKGK